MTGTVSKTAYEWRRLKTGLCWCIFGLGGLALSMTYFPFLRATVRDPVKRRLKARDMISKSFNLFVKTVENLSVITIDRESLKGLRSLKGTIIIANHPTILDYVLIASTLPEMDCLVKAQLKHNFFLKHVIHAADYLTNDGSFEMLSELCRRVSSGENILIFPEGSRTRPGVPMKLKRGVAHAALRARCPLAVVHIKSSHAWLNKESKWYDVPPARPSISLSFDSVINPSVFLIEGEEGYSHASRRLTEAMRLELMKTDPAPEDEAHKKDEFLILQTK